MGVTLTDPGLWVAVSTVASAAISGVVLAVVKLKREKIRADRDRSLLEIALRDSKPDERPAILGGLAGLRPLNASAPSDDDSGEGPPLPVKLTRKLRRNANGQFV
jgi:hypothetical protein